MPNLIARKPAQRHNCPHISFPRMPVILCIDDDPEIQTAIRLRMREYRVDIQQAFHGMQGIIAAIRSKPDLIVMDLAMPNGDGHYLLNCIRSNAESAGIPVIVLTGMRDPSLKRQVLAAGAQVYLQKPMRFDELIQSMSRFVDLQRHEDNGVGHE